MSATIARTPNFMLRRIVAVTVLALVLVAAATAVVHATQTRVHAQVARDGTVNVSGFDGGAPLQPSGQQ